AEIAFDDIEDLIAPAFGPVTLTLAFQRSVFAAAREGSRACLLLNSDFVLADGGLGYAEGRLRAGTKLLLAPTLRVTEEAIGPGLRAAVGAAHMLARPPRELMRRALPVLHHTVLSSRMDQGWLTSAHAHQLYWRAGADALLARPFCLFTLGLETKPAAEPVG